MKTYPFISVVVPAYNEATLLPLCLQSVRDQDYSGKYEIIVVDNNSTDLTPKIAELYGAKIIKEEKQGIAYARQAGFMAARGEIICSTDADTVVPRYWLGRFAQVLEKDKSLLAVGGWYELVGANNLLKILADFLAPAGFVMDKIITHGGSLYGVNFALRKEAFVKIGGFKRNLVSGEDVDLSQRLKKIGKVKTISNNTVKTSARRFDTGLWNVFKYQVVNYFTNVFWNKSIINFAQTIRERSFEVYGGAIKIPRWATILGITILTLFTLGAFPAVNMGSVSHIKTDQKVIALTFDDGPNDPETSQILDILKEKNIKATFFLIGRNVEREPEVVSEIYNAGHTMANHSESHSRRYMAGPPQLVLKDVNKVGDDICKLTGKKPRFFRPPYGYRTIWGDLELKKKDYLIFTWDDMTTDYARLSPDKIVRNIVKKAQPGGIIVLHDGDEKNNSLSHANTVAALPEIIDKLRETGYEFVTLDQLLGQKAYFEKCN